MKQRDHIHPHYAKIVRDFAEAILHGDERRRRWLLEAAEQFIKDGTIPPEK